MIVDDVHHLLAGSVPEQRQSFNQLKFLSNEFRMPIIALGTSEALYAMQTDAQIASRFEPFALQRSRESNALRSFVVRYGPGLIIMNLLEAAAAGTFKFAARARAESAKSEAVQCRIEGLGDMMKGSSLPYEGAIGDTIKVSRHKHWKQPKAIYREIMALGASTDLAQQIAGNCHRW